MKRLLLPLLSAACLLTLGTLTHAQIERLTLASMVAKTDNAIFGTIIASEVIRIDDAKDGPELYFTHLTISGETMEDGALATITVTFPGGFIDEESGAWNSEAPSADDIKIGNEVVAFYKYIENAGGGLACNFLYASHGGLYTTAPSPYGAVVLGRGPGYAIENNISRDDLDIAIRVLAEEEGQ